MFSISFHNVQGQLDKVVGIGEHLPPAHIYAFAETHFHNDSASSYEFPLPGFKQYWVCRDPSRCGGGISVFVHSSIKHSHLASSLQPEVVLLSLGSQELLLGVVYNPPESQSRSASGSPHNATETNLWFQHLTELVIQSPPHSHTCLVGDFNARVGDWQMQVDAHRLQPELPNIFSFPPRQSSDNVRNSFAVPFTTFLRSLGMGLLNGCVPGDEHGAFTRFPPHSSTAGAYIDLFDSDEEELGASLRFVPFHPNTTTQASVLDLAAVTPSLSSIYMFLLAHFQTMLPSTCSSPL